MFGFFQKFFQSAIIGALKEWQTSVAVKKGDFLGSLQFRQKTVSGLKVARVFGVMTIVVANSIGRLTVAVPTEVFLNRIIASSMGLLYHNFTGSIDGILLLILRLVGRLLGNSGGCYLSFGGRYATHGVVVVGIVVGVVGCLLLWNYEQL
jgi:hypothetical protein